MNSTQKYAFIDDALTARQKKSRFRTLTAYKPDDKLVISKGNRSYINFCGNDYLGLSKHPEVKEKVSQYATKYGAGSTASRLICGTYSIHQQLEEQLASTFGRESALLFNTGFQANSTIISTLADRHSLILADKLSHNSLLQGALSSRATFRRFQHNDIIDLEEKLEQASAEKYNRIYVITESLFSMDGDRSPLEDIGRLANRYNAWLFVDDAHAVGVWGKHGLGLTYDIDGIDMVLGTCGKAFGGFGAFLLCSARLREYLINFCDGFIFTTSLPPAVVGAIEASLGLIPNMDDARERLRRNIAVMKKGIHEAGFSTGDSDSQIIPIRIGKDEQVVKLSAYLEKQGFLASAIRPPTVPENSARIRVTLSSAHTNKQINDFLTALKSWNHG